MRPPYSAVTSHTWFLHVRSRLYRKDWSSCSSEFSAGGSRGRFVVEEDLNMWIEDLCEQLSVEWERIIAAVRIPQFKLVSAWVVKSASVKGGFMCDIWNVRLVDSVLRSVARRRLVETGNPSVCATVNCRVCKSEIVLCSLYLNVIKCNCVT
jgi:hypothetical protein